MLKKYLIALIVCLLPVIGIADTPDEERAEKVKHALISAADGKLVVGTPAKPLTS